MSEKLIRRPRIRPRKWDAQNSLGFWDINGSPNLSQTPRPSDNHQKKKKKRKREKKRTCWITGITERNRRKIYKYLDLARELQKTMDYESDGGTNCNSH